jgi:hypothetical protein
MQSGHPDSFHLFITQNSDNPNKQKKQTGPEGIKNPAPGQAIMPLRKESAFEVNHPLFNFLHHKRFVKG